MAKRLSDKQIRAKKENEMERTPSGFLLKQRAFLKLYMITISEKKRLYGLKVLEELKKEFKDLGYQPNQSEIYKAFHSLLEDDILEQVKEKRPGNELQVVVYYRIKDRKKANWYKSILREELVRCQKLIDKALQDNFETPKKSKVSSY